MAILGLKAKLYVGSAGSTASTEITNVKDVTLDLSASEADITTRAANGWTVYLPALKDATLSFTMNYEPTNSSFTSIQSAFFGHTALAMLVADNSGAGLDADFVYTGFTINQPLTDAVTVDVTARPTDATRAPAWYTPGVSSGSAGSGGLGGSGE